MKISKKAKCIAAAMLAALVTVSSGASMLVQAEEAAPAVIEEKKDGEPATEEEWQLRYDAFDNTEKAEADPSVLENNEFLSGIVLASTEFTEREPNNSKSNADRIYNDYIVNGTLSSSDLLDYYKVVIPSRSKVYITALSTKSSLMIGIQDSSENTKAVTTYQGVTDGYYAHTMSCTLDAGTYYIIPLDSNKAYNIYAFKFEYEAVSSSHTHSYTSKVTAPTCGAQGYTTYTCSCGDSYKSNYTSATGNHTYSDTSDTTCNTCGHVRQVAVSGDGTTVSKAVLVTMGQTYQKSWNKNTDHLNHYSKIVVPERGIVTVKATKPYDSEGECCKINFVFFDAEGNEIYGNDSSEAASAAKDFYEVSIGLEAGTYYLNMKPGFYVDSGTISTDYSIKFSANPYCEVEPNESTAYATNLKLAKMHTAFYGQDMHYNSGDNDYFKFKTTKGHKYRITVENMQNLSRTSAMLFLDGEYIDAYLEDNTDEKGRNYYEFKAASSKTSYLRLENYSGAQFKYGIMVTDLSVAAPKYISDATISGIQDKVYTGLPITQNITVKYGKTTLKEGTDYTISYKNNVNPGTATVTIKGTGKYSDSITKTFNIKEELIHVGNHVYSSNLDGKCNHCGVNRETVEERKVVHMFRMYNPNTGEHFYTGSDVEKNNLINAGWKYEGVGFTFPANTGAPVHRLFQPSTGEHLYTVDVSEKDRLLAKGWNYEGIAFNSAYDTEAVQYRLHNPNAKVGAYHFTFSQEERQNLLKAGWEDQGIGWYSCWK